MSEETGAQWLRKNFGPIEGMVVSVELFSMLNPTGTRTYLGSLLRQDGRWVTKTDIPGEFVVLPDVENAILWDNPRTAMVALDYLLHFHMHGRIKKLRQTRHEPFTLARTPGTSDDAYSMLVAEYKARSTFTWELHATIQDEYGTKTKFSATANSAVGLVRILHAEYIRQVNV